MSTRFERNDAGMRAITRTLGAQAALQAAQRGASWVQSNAPVRTGQYRSSIEAIPTTVLVKGQPRQGAAVVSTSDHAPWVEYGRGGMHLLSRSVNIIERG